MDASVSVSPGIGEAAQEVAGQVKWFDLTKGYGFIKPDDGGADIFFHVSALQEGDEITEGKAVSFETGPDLKTGKIKAISVDLT